MFCYCVEKYCNIKLFERNYVCRSISYDKLLRLLCYLQVIIEVDEENEEGENKIEIEKIEI